MGLERPQRSPAGPLASFALPRKAALAVGVVPKATPIDFPPPALRALEARRAVRLGDLHTNLHCSIIGTCLTTAELRQFVGKLDIADAKALSEHDLHKYGVTIAGQKEAGGPSQGSKLLHKLLDKKHRITLNQFAKAKTEAEVGAHWDAAVKNGEIPGAYWAVMSHSATTEALVKRVFGQVHMLSHLVGAANRADIRRLADLESENVDLHEKAQRQQIQIRDAVTQRDAKIRDLEALLAKALTQSVGTGDGAAEADALATMVANLERRLSSESGHRARLEERLKAAETRLGDARKARAETERRHAEIAAELIAAEALAAADETEAAPALDGRTILYVGGQTGHVANLRDAAARSGAKLIHHDGGIEDRNPQLAGLISQADIVFFPVDCISHDAMQTVKRLSRQAAKPYVPLRSAGLGSFLAALSMLARQEPEPEPAF
jgi:hypothetical protein